MDAYYDIYEIVKVLPKFQLFDAEFYQRNYCTNHGKPLTPGYYVVTWPEAVKVRRFNEHAAFHGPFKHRQGAQKLLTAMYNHQYTLVTQLQNSVFDYKDVIPKVESQVA